MKEGNFLCVLLFCCAIVFNTVHGGNSTQRTQLHQHLISGYDRTVYPGSNYSEPLMVCSIFK